MDKDKSFVGQPLLSQILDVIPSSLIYKVSRKHQAIITKKGLLAVSIVCSE